MSPTIASNNTYAVTATATTRTPDECVSRMLLYVEHVTSFLSNFRIISLGFRLEEPRTRYNPGANNQIFVEPGIGRQHAQCLFDRRFLEM